MLCQLVECTCSRLASLLLSPCSCSTSPPGLPAQHRGGPHATVHCSLCTNLVTNLNTDQYHTSVVTRDLASGRGCGVSPISAAAALQPAGHLSPYCSPPPALTTLG